MDTGVYPKGQDAKRV